MVGTSLLAGDTMGAQERTYWKASHANVAAFIRTSSWSAAKRQRFSGVGEIRHIGHVFAGARSSTDIRSCESLAGGREFSRRTSTSAWRNFNYGATTRLMLDLQRGSGRPRFCRISIEMLHRCRRLGTKQRVREQTAM